MGTVQSKTDRLYVFVTLTVSLLLLYHFSFKVSLF